MSNIPALVRFDSYATLKPTDLQALMPLIGRPQRISRGSYLSKQGDPAGSMYLLLEGWTASEMFLPDGSRQMLKVHLAGDMIGLPGLPLETVPDSVVALTDITVSPINAEALGGLFIENPRVAALLFLISQEERFLLMDRLTTVGRVASVGRLAGFLLQLHARMLRADPSIGATLQTPLNQQDFADLIGTTPAHCNRIIMLLRKRKLVSWTRQAITILDQPTLRALSGLPDRPLRRDQSWLP